LENLGDCDKEEIIALIEKNEAKKVTINSKEFNVGKDFVVKHELKTVNVMEEKYTPSVIEPSFGFGRIIYCLFEHKFRMRNEKRTFLDLPARIATYKCSILTEN